MWQTKGADQLQFLFCSALQSVGFLMMRLIWLFLLLKDTMVINYYSGHFEKYFE